MSPRTQTRAWPLSLIGNSNCRWLGLLDCCPSGLPLTKVSVSLRFVFAHKINLHSQFIVFSTGVSYLTSQRAAVFEDFILRVFHNEAVPWPDLWLHFDYRAALRNICVSTLNRFC